MTGTKKILMLSAAALLACGAARAQADIPRANTVVKPRALVSLQPAPRSLGVEVAVVAEILEGFHVNSNKPREEYLIPTTLAAEAPAGLRVVEISFPKGQVKKFEFSETPLDVYEGIFIIRMKLQVASDAPMGAIKIPMTLRYQACNDRACLPPVKLPVVADLEIAAAGTKPQSQHPNVFGKSKK